MKVRRQKLHWSVVPYGANGYIVKSQYNDVIREHTSLGLYDYEVMSRTENTAEMIANNLNSGILKVDLDNYCTIKN